jgi:sulfite oxidase
MNDKPLPVNHGFPVRVVIPGVAGARWVKWLDHITVQKEESTNHYQRHDYKILPPQATDSAEAKRYWNQVPAMEDMPVNSVVAVPNDNETIHLPDDSGLVEVKGYAVPHGQDGPVTRVEVSADGGKSWIDAELQQDDRGDHNRRWSWVLWKASVPMTKGAGKEILSRATDAGGNTQPEQSQWNLRGVGYNGYGASRNLTVV